MRINRRMNGDKCCSLMITFLISFTFFSLFMSSCEEEPLLEAQQFDLSLSLDTLRFDTVLTEIGTITRFVKIFNHESQPVIINEISLPSPDETFFRINVDGFLGPMVEDIRIEAQDSIWVFVEATIDPDSPLSESPFIIEDQLHITANQTSLVVQLEAFGQNANYRPSRFSAGDINPLCSGSIIWDDPKPYVIFGVLAVDQCELIIAAGTQIYVHGGIAINELGVFNDGLLIATETGSIQSMGTADNPVRIQSDRLEAEFQEVPGQWSGIFLSPGSRNNVFNHTIVQHSIVGLSIDSSATAIIDACEFSFTSGSGLVAANATIQADNCLFYENGTGSVNLSFGGSYNFNHCTIGNYNNQAPALSINNIRCSDPLCQESILVAPLEAAFNNCIITGNELDEISIFDITDGDGSIPFNYQLGSCAVTISELLEEDQFPNFFTDHCNNCIITTREDSLFLDLENYDFHLDTMSIVIDLGEFVPGIDTDFDGNPREINAVDLGCFEFQK